VCQLASWFNAYCLVRTVSSALEATAAAAALYHLARYRAAGSDSAAGRQLSAALLAAGSGVVVRPPSLLFWLLPGAFLWPHWGSEARFEPCHWVLIVGCIGCACWGGECLSCG